MRAEQPRQSVAAVSRREAGLAAIAAAAALASAAPAQAFGLFGGGNRAEEEYQQRTVSS